MTGTWIDLPSHRQWLARHATDLLTFGRNTGRSGGRAVWLDETGQPDESQGLQTWITARMVHVFGLGALLGIPGSALIAETALAGLTGPLRDPVHGGWYPTIKADGPTPRKACYDHVFLQRRTERVAHPRALRRFSEAATGLQPRPARRPVQTVRRHDRPRVRMGTAVPASRQLAAPHRPTLAAVRRRAALRPRRGRRLGARRRARLRVHDRLGRQAGPA